MEVWDSLSELTEMAINHWVEYCPERTIRLLKENRLGQEALKAAQSTQEQVYRAKPHMRDLMWEAVREQQILVPEERVTMPETEAGERRLEKLRDDLENLLDEKFPLEDGYLSQASMIAGKALRAAGLL